MMPAKSNYYSDAEPSSPNPSGPPDQDTAPEKEEEGDSQTAEIPKGVLGGKDFKPGEEVVLQVVQVMEDSVLVKYASEKGGEEKEEQAPEMAEAPGPGHGYQGGGLYS